MPAKAWTKNSRGFERLVRRGVACAQAVAVWGGLAGLSGCAGNLMHVVQRPTLDAPADHEPVAAGPGTVVRGQDVDGTFRGSMLPSASSLPARPRGLEASKTAMPQWRNAATPTNTQPAGAAPAAVPYPPVAQPAAVPYPPATAPQAFAAPGYAQPYANQPSAGQPYTGQPYAAQPYAAQPATRPRASYRLQSVDGYGGRGASGPGGPALLPGGGGEAAVGDLPPPAPGVIGGTQIPEALEYQEPDRWLNVDVPVEETETGRLMFGVGVNSDAGVIGNFVIDEQNFDWQRWPRGWSDFANGTAFRGAGQRFRVEVAPGTQVSRYLFSFQEPYLRDTAVSFGLSGFYYQRQFIDWNEDRTGGRVNFGYQIPDTDLSVSTAVRYENVKVYDPAVPTPPELASAVGSSNLVGFRLGVIHDTRDSPFLATEGRYVEMGFEQVVGDYTFPKFDAEWRRYFLIRERPDQSGRHVLSLKSRVGITGSNTPIFENYFAGGFSTLRGFDFRGASPRDLGVTVGGEFQFLNSVEYMFSLTADDMLRMVTFVDFGTVETDVAIRKENFRVAPGVGLRITVPAMGPAPIALDFAFPVAEAEGDDKRTFSFFIGFGR